jgi:hypothetical protein
MILNDMENGMAVYFWHRNMPHGSDGNCRILQPVNRSPLCCAEVCSGGARPPPSYVFMAWC